MNSRQIALTVLKKVYFEKLFPNVMLKKYQGDPQDISLATSIVYTTLQNDRYIEYQYEDIVEHTPHRTIQLILKMSVAQLFFMDRLAPYAVVNEAVELTKKERGEQAGKFVNAILNRLIIRGKKELEPIDAESASVVTSLPLWLFKMFEKQYSFEEALAYGEFSLTIAPTYYRQNPRLVAEERISNDPYLTVDSYVEIKDDLKNGLICIQDKGSQRVVEILDPKPNSRVLDCCCAPGTKTLYISDRMNDTGEIIAVDLVESRNRLVNEAIERWQVKNVKVVTQDIREYQDSELFDQILVDAPCSGLGVIRHKPDIKRNIKPSDLDELQKIQREILIHVASMVKVEGELVYSTCTINKKENQMQMQWFMKQFDNFEWVEQHQTNPILEDCDGFYIAKLRRTW